MRTLFILIFNFPSPSRQYLVVIAKMCPRERVPDVPSLCEIMKVMDRDDVLRWSALKRRGGRVGLEARTTRALALFARGR